MKNETIYFYHNIE